MDANGGRRRKRSGVDFIDLSSSEPQVRVSGPLNVSGRGGIHAPMFMGDPVEHSFQLQGSQPSAPINVESNVVLSSPMAFGQASSSQTRRPRGRAPLIDLEPVEDPNSNHIVRRIIYQQSLLDLELFVDLRGPWSPMREPVVVPTPLPPPPPPLPPAAPAPPPPPAPAAGPPAPTAFSCPICMGQLVEETSTRCGHIFCADCIRAALAIQPKCPTCLQKVTRRGLIRIYLPAQS